MLSMLYFLSLYWQRLTNALFAFFYLIRLFRGFLYTYTQKHQRITYFQRALWKANIFVKERSLRLTQSISKLFAQGRLPNTLNDYSPMVLLTPEVTRIFTPTASHLHLQLSTKNVELAARVKEYLKNSAVSALVISLLLPAWVLNNPLEMLHSLLWTLDKCDVIFLSQIDQLQQEF